MDQLPVEISQRIRHEARVAGLREERAPLIEMVERRRMQLWFLTVIIVVVLGLATLVASGTAGDVDWIAGESWILRGAVVALALGFCVYAVEKEIHLHRLSRLLVDERVLNSALAKRLQMNAALFNAGKALNSVLDLDDVLDAILANALDLLGGATGSVMLLEDEEQLRVVAVRGSRRRATPGSSSASRSPAGSPAAGSRSSSTARRPRTTSPARGPREPHVERDVRSAGEPGPPARRAEHQRAGRPPVRRVRPAGAQPLRRAGGRRIAKAGLYEAERGPRGGAARHRPDEDRSSSRR